MIPRTLRNSKNRQNDGLIDCREGFFSFMFINSQIHLPASVLVNYHTWVSSLKSCNFRVGPKRKWKIGLEFGKDEVKQEEQNRTNSPNKQHNLDSISMS